MSMDCWSPWHSYFQSQSHIESDLLIGTKLDENGMIRDGHRQDWEAGAAFVPPPGYWHSHHYESNADADVLQIQNASLQTYLRTLDIAFSNSGRADAGAFRNTP